MTLGVSDPEVCYVNEVGVNELKYNMYDMEK